MAKSGKSGQSASGAPPGAARRATSYPAPVQRLIDELARLPGVGRRSAERLALHLLKADAPTALSLSAAIAEVKRSIHNCAVCYNLTDQERCTVCADTGRDRSLVLVVEQPRDLLSIEETGMFRGLYHVLLGRLSPLEGIGPSDLTIAALLARLDDPAANAGGVAVREVVLGLNPTLEGDATALHLAGLIRSRNVKVSRLARGLPTGSTLEFASKLVLADAIEGRQEMQ